MPTTMGPEDLSNAPFREEDLDKPATLRQLKIVLDGYSDMETKFSTLCNHLGIDVIRNYQKFVVRDYRGMNGLTLEKAIDTAAKLTTPRRKWYQFWK